MRALARVPLVLRDFEEARAAVAAALESHGEFEQARDGWLAGLGTGGADLGAESASAPLGR